MIVVVYGEVVVVRFDSPQLVSVLALLLDSLAFAPAGIFCLEELGKFSRVARSIRFFEMILV